MTDNDLLIDHLVPHLPLIVQDLHSTDLTCARSCQIMRIIRVLPVSMSVRSYKRSGTDLALKDVDHQVGILAF